MRATGSTKLTSGAFATVGFVFLFLFLRPTAGGGPTSGLGTVAAGVVAISSFALAYSLYRQRRSAYVIAVGVLGYSLLGNLQELSRGADHSWRTALLAIILAVLLLLLFADRRSFFKPRT